MAENKKQNGGFWDEHKITVIPLIGLACSLALMYGIYVGAEKYNKDKADRHRQEKLMRKFEEAKQTKDTIVVDSVVTMKK